MEQQHVQINDRQLGGELHTSNDHSRLVIMCHGFQSSKDNSTLMAIREGLNKQGYNTFSFNFTENIGGFDIAHQVEDVRQIANHFSQYKEIILLAASFGALTSSIATIQIPKIRGLITLNGFFGAYQLGPDYRRNYWKFRIAALIIPKYWRIRHYYKKHLKPKRIKVPVLVIHSVVDQSVKYIQSQQFFKKLTSKKQFISLEKANHGISSDDDRTLVIKNICDWLKVY